MSLVNTNQLARIIGVSHTAINKAVKVGRLSVAELDEKGRKLFDPETAVVEWGENTNPAKARETKAGGRPRKDGTPAQPRVTATTAPHHPSRPGGRGGALNTGGGLRGPRAPDGEDGDSEGRTTYNEAAAIEKHYKAQLAKLEYEQKIGALVPIENVAQEVEKEYSRVRARLLAIPSKLAPDVALAEDVAACRELIEAAITDALNELAAYEAGSEPAADDGN